MNETGDIIVGTRNASGGPRVTIEVSEEAIAHLKNKKRHLNHLALVMADKNGRRTVWDEDADDAYDRGKARGENAELVEICNLLGIMPEITKEEVIERMNEDYEE